MARWIDRLKSWFLRRSAVDVVLLALALRVSVFALAMLRATGPETFCLEDSSHYLASATSLLEHGEFSRAGTVEILRTPGYPLLLLPGLALGHVTAVTILIQIALSCATVYLVYRLARLISLPEPWARVAALLYALEPLSILFCCKIMTETLFAFLIVSCWFCVVAYLTDNRWRWPLLAGAALGLAVLVRPIAYYLPPLIGAALIVRALWSADRRWTKCLQALTLLSVAWAPALGWTARNHIVAGYNRFAAIEDLNVYFYTAASITARQKGVAVIHETLARGQADPALYNRLHPEQVNWTNVQRYNYMRREGLKTLRANLGQYFLIHLEGIAPLLMGGGASETIQLLGLDALARNQDKADQEFNGVVGYARRLLSDNPALFCCNVVLSLIAVALLAAAVLGAARRSTVRRLPLVFLICGAVYFLALSGGPSGRPRYRHPAMPVFCLFAAAGVRRVLTTRQQRGPQVEVPPVVDKASENKAYADKERELVAA